MRRTLPLWDVALENAGAGGEGDREKEQKI